MKRVFLCLLASLLVFAGTACSGSNEAETDAVVQDTATVEEAEVAETSRADMKDDLPEDLNFDGTEINLIIRPEFAKYDATGENGGDVVYDAVYQRNLTVEERLNVKLNYIMAEEHFDAMAKQVSNSVIAGMDEYDIVQQRAIQTFQQSLEGLFMNMSQAPHINMEKPWWWMDIVNDTAINNEKIYFLTGDMSISTFLLSTVCFVNKQMLADFGHDIDELYTLVEDGEWTWERFQEYCSGVYTDTNGDGTADEDDTYAFSYLGYGAAWFNYSSGLKFISRDADGFPVMAINNENTIQLLETISHIWYDNNNGFAITSGDYPAMVKKFTDGKNLFCMGRFMHTDLLRDFEDPYGVIPYPKLDVQYDYMSGTGASGNFLSIPVTSADYEAACAVLEAASAENYRKVFPAFYETALKIKYVSDNRDAQMIDIVHDSIYVDFMYISGLNNVVDGLLSSKNLNFASEYAKQETAMQTKLDEFIEKYNHLS